MAGRELALLEQLLDRRGQAQEAERVGDMAATLSYHARQVFLGMGELLHQPPIGLGFFERGQILSLNVLDKGNLKRLAVGEVPDNDRNLMELGLLRRAPAPLASDDLIRRRITRKTADEDRLEDALRLDGAHQGRHLLGIETMARLESPGA